MNIVQKMIVCVALATLLLGCGKDCDFVSLGEATVQRRTEFVGAVVRACSRFEELDASDVKFNTSVKDGLPLITISCARMKPMALERAISVALTNISMVYPGLGFMSNGDGSWNVLMPAEIRIPKAGGFGIGLE